MYFTSKKLSNNLIEALKKAEVVFNATKDRYEVEIPQLDRQDYDSFKKILEEIHGAWNCSAQAHVFDRNPTAMLNKVIEIGCFPQRKPHEAFFTPREVTEKMINWCDFYYNAELLPHWRYLEPQAGQGFILDVLRAKYPGIEKVFDTCEIDPFNRSVLERKGYRVVAENFLNANLDPVYNWIVMNPPFNGKAGDYIDHINEAFRLLVPKGRLTAIVPTIPFLTSRVKRVEDFRNKVFTYGDHENLAPDAFKSSGTNTACTVIRMIKYSDEQIERFENPKNEADEWGCYVTPIVIALESGGDFCYPVHKLVEKIKCKSITSKERFIVELDTLTDHIVRQHIEQEGCSFQWDTLIRKKVVNYLFESVIGNYFGTADPFQSTKPRQLSLFE